MPPSFAPLHRDPEPTYATPPLTPADCLPRPSAPLDTDSEPKIAVFLPASVDELPPLAISSRLDPQPADPTPPLEFVGFELLPPAHLHWHPELVGPAHLLTPGDELPLPPAHLHVYPQPASTR